MERLDLEKVFKQMDEIIEESYADINENTPIPPETSDKLRNVLKEMVNQYGSDVPSGWVSSAYDGDIGMEWRTNTKTIILSISKYNDGLPRLWHRDHVLNEHDIEPATPAALYDRLVWLEQ